MVLTAGNSLGLPWSPLILCSFGLYVFACCAVFGIAVLIPINHSASGGDACTSSTGAITTCSSGDSSQGGLDSISMSNVPQKDPRLWAHLVSAYVFIGAAVFFLERLYKLVRVHEGDLLSL